MGLDVVVAEGDGVARYRLVGRPIPPSPLRRVEAAAWLLAAVMAAAVLVGLTSAEQGAAGELLANVWGRVTIVDLYLALGAVACWIGWRERSAARTLGWVLALVVTGSVAVFVYVGLAAHRSRTVTELLTGPQDITLD